MLADFDFDLSDRGLRVDGGMVGSEWTMQFLADMLDCPIDRPRITKTTALGVAWLAGYTTGCWLGMDGFSKAWQRERRFAPRMDEGSRTKRYAVWQASVSAAIQQAKHAP